MAVTCSKLKQYMLARETWKRRMEHSVQFTNLRFGIDGNVNAESKPCQCKDVGECLDDSVYPHQSSKRCCPYKNSAQGKEKCKGKAHQGSMCDYSIMSSWIDMLLFLLSAGCGYYETVSVKSTLLPHKTQTNREANKKQRKNILWLGT